MGLAAFHRAAGTRAHYRCLNETSSNNGIISRIESGRAAVSITWARGTAKVTMGGHNSCLSFPPYNDVGWIWHCTAFIPSKRGTQESPHLEGNRWAWGCVLCPHPISKAAGMWGPRCASAAWPYVPYPPLFPQIPMGNNAQEPQPLLTATLWGFWGLGWGFVGHPQDGDTRGSYGLCAHSTALKLGSLWGEGGGDGTKWGGTTTPTTAPSRRSRSRAGCAPAVRAQQ